MLKPDKVFRPGKLPIQPGNVYASRGATEGVFKKSLQRGFIPLVYGEYGVGKTSMARHVVKEVFGEKTLVNIESVCTKNLDDIFLACLEKVHFLSEKKEPIPEKKSLLRRLMSFFFGTRNAAGSDIERPYHPNVHGFDKEKIRNSISDSKIIQLCEYHGIVLILDEIHKANDEFLDELVRFVKIYGNASCERFKIILLGTSSESTKLVHKDPGIDRLVEDIHLRPMSPPEIRFVIDAGMSNLAIGIDDRAREKLSSISGGYPNILQYLCLEASEFAFARKSRKLDQCDVENALKNYVEKKESRLHRLYMQAIEDKGKKKYRKNILRAMAQIEDDYVSTDCLCLKINDNVDYHVNGQHLSGPLKLLKSDKYGALLRDVERSGPAGRIQTYTTFSDPALKSFLRIQDLRESEAFVAAR